MSKRFAFLGPHGTFTEEAARFFIEKLKEDEIVLLPHKNIPDCLDAAHQGKVDFAVVPIENALEGSVNLTVDWLIHHVQLSILGEVALPISHQLLVANRNKTLAPSEIKKIYSHPQALAQTHNFIRDHLPHVEIESTNSTAEAAKLIGQNSELPWAAIGTRLAAELYDLNIMYESIGDYPNNYTRFILVGQEGALNLVAEEFKTSILVTLPKDFPSALNQVLSPFAWRRLNLTRIESRPTKKGLGSYHFVIDIQKGMDAVLMPGALAEIEALGCSVKLFGSYPCYIKYEKENDKQ